MQRRIRLSEDLITEYKHQTLRPLGCPEPLDTIDERTMNDLSREGTIDSWETCS